ncbi:hemagglutinin repeat-containing protein, partial [Rodentibacter trehalosifermentans]|uniref:hemagglutinin repeat-containing protein n=1 Tax=Rodentibacter trehalosifermentans TaxID=1908263 RepID=UPI0015C407E8
GVNVGVAVKVSGGIGGGITLGGNYGKGYGNGDETTYVASHVGTKTSETTVKAGGDTHIIGSQVSGKGVIIDTDNLHIESLQDKSTYQGKQMNIAGSVTVGVGFAAGGSFNKSKVNSDYASVNEQAGIFAGDEGYDVNVKDKVSLTGGAILSQAPKEKNQLTAQDFEYSNIQNYSNAKSSAMGLMGGVSFGRDQTSDEDKELNDVYRKGREGESFEQANPNKANELPVKFGLGTDDIHSTDFYAAAKVGLANLASNSKQSENHRSTTYSVISEGNFNIGSTKGRENIESIKKSTEQESNKLEKVDYAKMQKDVERDMETIQGFAKNLAGLTDEAYRSQFITEHRLMTFELNEKGEPIIDEERENDLKEQAKEVYEKEKPQDKSEEDFIGDYIKRNPTGMNIYKLREVSDQERVALKQVKFFDQETKTEKQSVAVMFNGILNNLQAAAKYATQNYIVNKDGNKIYQNLYFVHNPEANNVFSELMVAFYQKNMEGVIGGLGNSTIQAKNLMA